MSIVLVLVLGIAAAALSAAMAGMAQRLRARAVLRTAVNKRFSFILLHNSFYVVLCGGLF